MMMVFYTLLIFIEWKHGVGMDQQDVKQSVRYFDTHGFNLTS